MAQPYLPNFTTTTAEWSKYSTFLTQTYEEPDLDACRILLSTIQSHYLLQAPPVFLFLMGIPGSGKTEIGITPLSSCPRAEIMGQITSQAFLSAYGSGRDSNSLLSRTGKSGIWLFKDFTSILSMPPEKQKIIAGNLREIYDGSIAKDSGNRTKKLFWKGKITCIAATTPQLESHWEAFRDLGERFLTLRWRHPLNLPAAMHKAMFNAAKKSEIHATLSRLGFTCLNLSKDPLYPEPHSSLLHHLTNISILLSRLRAGVRRDTNPSRDIVEVSQPELPTRIFASLSQIIRGHACLMRRTYILPEDVALAMRVATDSIPGTFWHILSSLISYMNANPIRQTWQTPRLPEILRLSSLPPATFYAKVQDLTALKVIEVTETKSDGGNFMELTPTFQNSFHALNFLDHPSRDLPNAPFY